MKQIIVFRHGKSSRETPGLPDAERPLLQKGEERTRRMALYLLDQGIQPDLLVSSHAVRAYQTAQIAAGILKCRTDILVEPLLYHASTDRIWDVIFALPETAGSVVLFGHNPGLTEFISQSGMGQTDWLPTSGIAYGAFPCNHWHECASMMPIIHFVTWPANIR